jgi:tetratricopeptide (TPR) repeat protein
MAYQPELEKLERRYDEDPARHFAQLAEAYRKGGRLDEALGLLHDHLAGKPNYVSGLIVLGRCLLDQKDDAQARETFERVVAVDAEHIIALRALGEIGERTGDFGGARRWYQRLLDIDPMNEEAKGALARLPEGGAVVEVAEEVAEAEVAEAAAASGAGVAEVAEEVAEAVAADGEAEQDEGAEEPVGTEAGAPGGAPVNETPGLEEIERMWADAPPSDSATPDFFVERTSAEQGAGMGSMPWDDESDLAGDTSIALPEDDERMIDFGELPPGPAASASPPAEAETDGASWVEHPDEPISFKDLEPAEDAADVGSGGQDALVAEPFDEALGWGAGERVSRQISAEDIQQAEHAHDADLALPVQELPGLHDAETPSEFDIAAFADAEPVAGLQQPEGDVEAEPVEGLEPDAGMLMPPPTVVEAEPPTPEPERDAAEPDDADFAEVLGASAAGDDARTSLSGLPVFFPPEDEAKEPLQVEPEPEPVVTETMAELYVQQGLMSEARDTYRQLLASRPHDRRLSARLAELDRASPRREARTVYAASLTGGQPTRAFLVEILAGQRAAAATVADEPVEGVAAPEDLTFLPEAAEPADFEPAELEPAELEPVELEPVDLEPMEEAFGDESTEPRGEPTQPAKDELSLAAIFGEAPPSVPRAQPDVHADDAARSPGGFSFDEFFSSGAPDASAEAPHPPRDTLADDEGDEAFRDWLKGLKS